MKVSTANGTLFRSVMNEMYMILLFDICFYIVSAISRNIFTVSSKNTPDEGKIAWRANGKVIEIFDIRRVFKVLWKPRPISDMASRARSKRQEPKLSTYVCVT